jgi:hypothetical protein
MGLDQELQAQRSARWPSVCRRKEDSVDFKRKKLSNETHGSDTDPDARLYSKRKTKEAKLCYLGHTCFASVGNGLSGRLS